MARLERAGFVITVFCLWGVLPACGIDLGRDDSNGEYVCGNGRSGTFLYRDGRYYHKECDDRNGVPGDGCHECFAEPGWTCDDVDLTKPCTPNVCGNGRGGLFLYRGAAHDKECDDGNDVQGDGCHECFTEPGWICDEADVTKPCTPVCGDGALVGGEVCEPAIPVAGHTCDRCKALVPGACGDGAVLASFETCDDANAAALDGCTACAVDFGYRCTGAPSTCSATGIDGARKLAELDSAERRLYCEWLARILGGPGTVLDCGSFIVNVSTVEMCVARLTETGFPDTGHCPVRSVEELAARVGSACAFFAGGSQPPC